MAAGRGRRSAGEGDDLDRPVVITRARQSYEEELAYRKKRYFLLMSIRIPALVLAAISYMIWHNGWIALAIVGGSIPIPWIAVVGANDRPALPKDQPRPYAGSAAFSMPSGYALPSAVTGSATAEPGARTAPTDSPAEEPDRPARPTPSRPSPEEHGHPMFGPGDHPDLDVSGYRPSGRQHPGARPPAGSHRVDPDDPIVIDAED